jgi:hypothetical protein
MTSRIKARNHRLERLPARPSATGSAARIALTPAGPHHRARKNPQTIRAPRAQQNIPTASVRRVEALALLAPIHDWFTEGHDTRDLKEATQHLLKLRSAQTSQQFRTVQ